MTIHFPVCVFVCVWVCVCVCVWGGGGCGGVGVGGCVCERVDVLVNVWMRVDCFMRGWLDEWVDGW